MGYRGAGRHPARRTPHDHGGIGDVFDTQPRPVGVVVHVIAPHRIEQPVVVLRQLTRPAVVHRHEPDVLPCLDVRFITPGELEAQVVGQWLGDHVHPLHDLPDSRVGHDHRRPVGLEPVGGPGPAGKELGQQVTFP